MGSSAKKKKEKKKDFQKPKLKVGKTRPKNTNATDTSFSAKSIVFKQQSLSEFGRDPAGLFHHNLSLLSSRNDTQRRDALAYLATVCTKEPAADLPQPPSAIIMKAQPLLLDGSPQVRSQLLKLVRALPSDQLGPLDQLLLFCRAGMAHLSTDIRLSALEVLDWLLATNGTAVVSVPGGWVKSLQTFQTLLSWNATGGNGKWSASKPPSSVGGVGLTMPSMHEAETIAAKRAAASFPLWDTDLHMAPRKSNPFGYLNLFGAPRNIESEIYDEAEERIEVFNDTGLKDAFEAGVKEAKKEGGEVGRAAALVDKALRLADVG